VIFIQTMAAAAAVELRTHGFQVEPYPTYAALFREVCHARLTKHREEDQPFVHLGGIPGDRFRAQGQEVTLPRYAALGTEIRRLQDEYAYVYRHQVATARSQAELNAGVAALIRTHRQVLQLAWLASAPPKTAPPGQSQAERAAAIEAALALAEPGPEDLPTRAALLARRHALAGERSVEAAFDRAEVLVSRLPAVVPVGAAGAGAGAGDDGGDDDGDGGGDNPPKKKKGKKAAAAAAAAAAPEFQKPPSPREKIERVKDRVLRLVINHAYPLNKFRFSKVEDCLALPSKNRPYALSRQQIVATIDADPALQRAFPKNYKSLSKEQLCAHLFRLGRPASAAASAAAARSGSSRSRSRSTSPAP
jgi:hypothetical protein